MYVKGLSGQGFRGCAAASLYNILTGLTELPGRATLMFPAAFLPFVEKRPVGVMARAIVERFFDPQPLDALFERTAVAQYERHLLFSSVVELMQAVVLGVEPSVFAAYRKRRHSLPVSDDSVYN